MKKCVDKFYQFIFISTVFLGFILYIYYKNETKCLVRSCMELQNVSMHVKSEILNKHMKKSRINPKKIRKCKYKIWII